MRHTSGCRVWHCASHVPAGLFDAGAMPAAASPGSHSSSAIVAPPASTYVLITPSPQYVQDPGSEARRHEEPGLSLAGGSGGVATGLPGSHVSTLLSSTPSPQNESGAPKQL